MPVVAAAAVLTARARSGMAIADGFVEFLENPSTAAMRPLASLSGGSWFYLARHAVPARVLVVLDGLLLQAICALALAPYLVEYAFSSPGHVTCVATLSIVLLLRAIAVPSTGRRTLLFSLPAPVVILVAQLDHGGAYAHVGGEPCSERYFAEFVVLDQFLLGVSILGAVMAPRMTGGLRRRSSKPRDSDPTSWVGASEPGDGRGLRGEARDAEAADGDQAAAPRDHRRAHARALRAGGPASQPPDASEHGLDP